MPTTDEKTPEEVKPQPVTMKAEVVVEEEKPEETAGETAPVQTSEQVTTPTEEVEVPEPAPAKVQELTPQVEQPPQSLMDKPEPVPAVPVVAKKSKKKPVIIVGIVLAVVAVIGVVLFRGGVVAEPVEQEVVESPSPEPSVTPEPTPAGLLRSEITIEVMNGSGVSGAAGKLATTLEELGYTIGEVGNAEETTGYELYVQE